MTAIATPNVWRAAGPNLVAALGHPPTNIVTPPAGGHALAISNALDATPVGGTYKLARGIYELDFRTHPQNASYRTCITVPNGRTFDFSQAELRLKAGQARMTEDGLTSGQLADVISNRFLGSTSPLTNRAEDITIVVGCLDGQAAQQGNGDNQQGTDECWFDGIALWNALNCTITATWSPWSKRKWAQRGDGLWVPHTVHGAVKNIRGWDGAGGVTETFSYDWPSPRGGCLTEFIETCVDDGSSRSSTGGSSNGGTGVTHRDCWGHDHSSSHGATSWHTTFVTRERCLYEANFGAGFRFEYGWGHIARDIISRNSEAGSGLNLKGEESPPAGSVMLDSERLTLLDNDQHAVQINSIVGAVLEGWYRVPAGKLKVHFADQLYGSRASTGVVSTALVAPSGGA